MNNLLPSTIAALDEFAKLKQSEVSEYDWNTKWSIIISVQRKHILIPPKKKRK